MEEVHLHMIDKIIFLFAYSATTYSNQGHPSNFLLQIDQ